MPRPPISDAKRKAIEVDLRSGHKRNQIARDQAVSPATVSSIAKSIGLVFDRSKTKNATQAAVADNRALRASTSRRFIEEANKLLDQVRHPHLVFNFGGKDNTYESRVLPTPPSGDIRNLIISAATAFDKHLAAEKHDSGSGADAAKSLLSSLGDAITSAATELPADES